jgi:hypothetical protein
MTSFDLTSSKNKVDWNVLPLDPDLYWMQDSEREFFRAHTGIQDDEELKRHVLDVQRQAYSVSVASKVSDLSVVDFSSHL